MEILHEKGLKVLKFKSETASDEASTPPVTVNSSSQATKRRNKKDEEFVNRILYLIITALVVLIVRDVYQVAVMRRQTLEKERYVKAVRSSSEAWTTGWKLEELQSKLRTQNTVLRSLMLKLHAPFLSTFLRGNKGESLGEIEADVVTDLMSHVENVTAMNTWTCVTSPDTLLRVGPVDFFDATPENCLVHSVGEGVGPSSIFEVVQLGDGFVGFRSLANGKFVKMTPPASGKSSDPWWLDIASPVPGLAERFRLEQGRLIYNELLQGYIKCGGSGPTTALGSPIQGVPGTRARDVQFKAEFQFTLHGVTEEQLAHARVLKAAAKTLERKSSAQVSAYLEASKIKLQYESFTAKETLQKDGAKIAIVIPVTSKDTYMDSVGESPFFRNTLASFLQTIDWRANGFSYTFFLGFDQGDALYDTGDAWSDMRQAFQSAVELYLTGMYGRGDSTAEFRHRAAQQLSLRLKHFKDKEGAPSQVVSELVRDAYEDGFDYFFQVNDDTVFKTKDWPSIFTSTLAESPLYANLGVTGPYDMNNPRILTHAFVHRTHLDIFEGHFFPEVFKNWWSDDWISALYGRHGTFRSHSVTVLHNVHSQKKGNTVQRYKVDESAQLRLRAQVLHGITKVNAFLASKGRPRLPLPEVCGYVPLVEELYTHLQQQAGEAQEEDTSAETDQALDAQRVREQNMVQYEIQKHPPAQGHSHKADMAQHKLPEDLEGLGLSKDGVREGEGEQRGGKSWATDKIVSMPRDAYWGLHAHAGSEATHPKAQDRIVMRELDEGLWARGQGEQDTTVEDLADADW